MTSPRVMNEWDGKGGSRAGRDVAAQRDITFAHNVRPPLVEMANKHGQTNVVAAVLLNAYQPLHPQ